MTAQTKKGWREQAPALHSQVESKLRPASGTKPGRAKKAEPKVWELAFPVSWDKDPIKHHDAIQKRKAKLEIEQADAMRDMNDPRVANYAKLKAEAIRPMISVLDDLLVNGGDVDVQKAVSSMVESFGVDIAAMRAGGLALTGIEDQVMTKLSESVGSQKSNKDLMKARKGIRTEIKDFIQLRADLEEKWQEAQAEADDARAETSKDAKLGAARFLSLQMRYEGKVSPDALSAAKKMIAGGAPIQEVEDHLEASLTETPGTDSKQENVDAQWAALEKEFSGKVEDDALQSAKATLYEYAERGESGEMAARRHLQGMTPEGMSDSEKGRVEKNAVRVAGKFKGAFGGDEAAENTAEVAERFTLAQLQALHALPPSDSELNPHERYMLYRTIRDKIIQEAQKKNPNYKVTAADEARIKEKYGAPSA